MNRHELFEYIHNLDVKDLFEAKPTVFDIPDKAQIFDNISCFSCDEETVDGFIKYYDSKPYCLDCFKKI